MKFLAVLLCLLLFIFPVFSDDFDGVLKQLEQKNNANGITLGTVKSGTGSATNPLLWDRVFVMFFENHGYLQTLHSKPWQSIIQKSTWLTNFHATTHPSQPNYIATIAGDTVGVHGDGYYSLDQTSLIDLLEKKGVSWKSYQENYTPSDSSGNCNDAERIGLYARKHNPFMSFKKVRSSLKLCQNIVNSDQLSKDIESGNLPQFSFYTPNMNNDAHDTGMDFAGNYLHKFYDKYITNPKFTQNTLILITFDEDEWLEFQHIAAMMFGSYVKPGTSIDVHLNHYSITKAIEDNWGLGNLGRNDVGATSLIELWKPTTKLNNKANDSSFLSHIKKIFTADLDSAEFDPDMLNHHDSIADLHSKIDNSVGNQHLPIRLTEGLHDLLSKPIDSEEFNENEKSNVNINVRISTTDLMNSNSNINVNVISQHPHMSHRNNKYHDSSIKKHYLRNSKMNNNNQLNKRTTQELYKLYMSTIQQLTGCNAEGSVDSRYSLIYLEPHLFPSLPPINPKTYENSTNLQGKLIASSTPQEALNNVINILKHTQSKKAQSVIKSLMTIRKKLF